MNELNVKLLYYEKQLKMFWESERLKSFGNKWIFNETDQCSATKLAMAGFYYHGTINDPDLVICFLCNKQLDGWESTDDPWNEHKKHAAYCQFAIRGKTEAQLTQNDLFDLKKELINVFNKRLTEDSFEQISQAFSTFKKIKK